MIPRLIACGALACCLIAGGAAASADLADARPFKGKTSQSYEFKAQVRERAFRIQVFDVDLRCRDGSELPLTMSGYLWTKVGKRGSFRDAQFGRTDATYFRGRLNERRLRGRLRVTDRLRDGTRSRSSTRERPIDVDLTVIRPREVLRVRLVALEAQLEAFRSGHVEAFDRLRRDPPLRPSAGEGSLAGTYLLVGSFGERTLNSLEISA